MFEYIDRELAEAVWQETLEMMTDAEIAEMVRRQEADMKADYWDAAWKEMRREDEESEGL